MKINDKSYFSVTQYGRHAFRLYVRFYFCFHLHDTKMFRFFVFFFGCVCCVWCFSIRLIMSYLIRWFLLLDAWMNMKYCAQTTETFAFRLQWPFDFWCVSDGVKKLNDTILRSQQEQRNDHIIHNVYKCMKRTFKKCAKVTPLFYFVYFFFIYYL